MVNVFNFGLLSTATIGLWFRHTQLKSLCRSCTVVSCALQTYFLIFRWFEYGHFPLSNLYESLFFLSWALTAFVTWWFFRSTLYENLEGENIVMPLIVGINGFMLFLPSNLKTSSFLVPALQSNWLQMHVGVMIASYACLILGCLFAIAYLVVDVLQNSAVFTFKPKNQNNCSSYNNNVIEQRQQETNTFYFNQALTKLLQTWDNFSYRLIGLGFPLLTMGLLSGAVWANQTWGSYWSWDPKETWALITWFVFAIYLHTRISKAWNGKKSAWLAVFGFIILWVCYLGVNLMAKGLHSYGWFQ